MKDFQVISRLGEGSYSSVWKVKRISDGQEYAMKKVKLASLSEKEKENALNEVRILASINDPNIVAYKEAFLEDNSMTLCIVMEYAGGGDVYNKIVSHQKRNTFFPEEEIWKMLISMLQGLKKLHDMKILHRDLKCANVFLSSDSRAKLGDLNVSKVAKANLAYTQTGTPYYASPEVWRDQPYDMKSDIWSLGCVLYEVTALKPPFRANDMEGLYKKVQRGIFDRIPTQYSIDLYNIICQMLQVSPSMRPNCDGLLNHPIVIKKAREVGEEIVSSRNAKQIGNSDSKGELLKTIKMPKNPKGLNQQLPKANYAHQSLEIEKGKLKTIDEIDGNVNGIKRNISSGNGKRAVSQQVPLNTNVLVRPSQSRESKISQMNKANIQLQQKETEMDYLQRMQRDYIDRAKPVKHPSQPLLDDYSSPKGGIPASKLQQQQLLQKQPSYPSRAPAPDPYDKISKQEQLINKYQNRVYMDQQPGRGEQLYQRILSEKDNLNKKADYIIQKYQQPLQPLPNPVNNAQRVSSAGGANRERENPKELIGKYNNIYNLKDKYDQTPDYKRDIVSPYLKKPDYQYGANQINSNQIHNNNRNGAIYQNNYNHIKPQHPIQPKASRPIWWG
jgi:serine/threonine protein kinase